MSLGNLIWVFTLCSNLYPCLFTPFSLPHPEHCIFSAQIQCTPLDELFCCHDQWVTISLVYRLSAVSREESWPQEKLCQDKWDYQPDPSHCYSTWASRPDRRGATSNGVTAKDKSEVLILCNIQIQFWVQSVVQCGDFTSLPCALSAWRQAWESLLCWVGRCHGPCWSASEGYCSSVSSPASDRRGNRQSWTGTSFFSIPAEVAIAARMLSLALVPKRLWLELATIVLTAGMDCLLAF